ELDDFYAYDDGSAEVGADVDLRLGSVAVQFILNQPDTLGAVRINFTPYFQDQTNNDFLLQVFSNRNGRPDRAIIQQTIKVAYPATLNGFVEYELSKSIAVTDTFYVGWSRLTDQAIAVGFDKNSPQFSDKIFYNLGSEWLTNRSRNGVNRVNGSFMLRPVMGFRSTGSPEENEAPLASESLTEDDFIVYPNPASQKISWKKTGEFIAQVVESNGRLVIEKRTNKGFIDVSSLSAGTYILRLSNRTESFTKKIIIIK
ncbi:MAG: T9SS type A sorting domain-containing protein, partial [Spirosomaceae bacterium]|nr:T9SS type A sorting domain-containing protein [Spirosomataceae bacterium]